MDKKFIDNPVEAYERLKEENYGLNQELLGYKKGVQASEIIELKAENERLKKEIKNNKSAYQVELGTYNMECSNLLEENKELAHYLACMTEQRNKANTCLQEIKKIAEALSCKHPEDCWENTPDWNGEVYGCDVADNWKEPSELATCPSKLASAILQIITEAEEE